MAIYISKRSMRLLSGALIAISLIYLLQTVPQVRAEDNEDGLDLLDGAASEQLEVAESKGAGAGAGGAVLSKGGFKKGAAAGFKTGAKGAAGFGAKAGKKAGFAKGGAAAAAGFKKGGKKAGFASGAGYAAKFGKKGGKFGSFAAGHKKAFGTIKAFHHNSAFKFGKGGAFGAAGGASKGFAAKKGFAGAAGAAGFKKGAKGGAKGFAAGGAAKAGFKKGAAAKAAFKKGDYRDPSCNFSAKQNLFSNYPIPPTQIRINRWSCRWQSRRLGRQRRKGSRDRQIGEQINWLGLLFLMFHIIDRCSKLRQSGGRVKNRSIIFSKQEPSYTDGRHIVGLLKSHHSMLFTHILSSQSSF